ncbi:hypothetical protein C8F04DRAFT_1262147 [Mycena alexandri]|uniref:Uncharacterized protein n=1 Tax=Mycena alexandri TaxID=1745969 RepID=A0AAD6SS74_9AGAR|nr:hypothetical protein C8F04DRAFT_1262147 [Mycena alexandri]
MPTPRSDRLLVLTILSFVSPPPPYPSSVMFSILELPDVPATPGHRLQSREELTELIIKADDLIKERETVCKSLLESNVTLKNKHHAMTLSLPAFRQPLAIRPHCRMPRSRYWNTGQDASFISNHSDSSCVYLKRQARRISISPNDIFVLADQNAEQMQKLETVESEALTVDRTGRRALKQLLRAELEKTQARSEVLEKIAQAGTEKIVEEITASGRSDDGAIRNFAPAGFFSKSVLSPSSSVEFLQDDEDEERENSYGAEHFATEGRHSEMEAMAVKPFEHPHRTRCLNKSGQWKRG